MSLRPMQFIVSPQLKPEADLTPEVSRLISQADRDIANGHFESALDLTLLAHSLAPEYIPLYLRRAELLVVTGRFEQAAILVRALERLAAEQSITDLDDEIERISAHMDPTADKLVRLMERLFAADRRSEAGQYAVAAIDLMIDKNETNKTVPLAARWYELSPADPQALYVHVRELIRAGRYDEALLAIDTVTPEVAKTVPLKAAQLAALCIAGSIEQWPLSVLLANQIKSRELDRATFTSLIEEFVEMSPSCKDLPVHYGLIHVAAGHAPEALTILQQATPSSPLAELLAAIGLTRSALAMGDDQVASDSISRVHALLSHPQIREARNLPGVVPERTETNRLSKDAAALLRRSGRADQAARILGRLLTESPEDADLMQEYAEALTHTGNRDEALAELHSLLARQLQIGNLNGAIQTMTSILHITPSDEHIQNELISSLSRLGRLAEAASELIKQAELMVTSNRVDDALNSLQKAAQIAEAAHNDALVEHVYQSMTKLRPTDLAIRYAAVTAFLQRQRIPLALEQLRAIVRIALTNKEPHEALSGLQQIISLSPRDAEAHHVLARILTSMGDYTAAERLYERLVEIQPDNPAWKEKQSEMVARASGRS